jgi:mannose-6-phosphate isomerase-like protein (cupin superfamily)
LSGKSLARFPVHLGPGATAVAQPEFTGDMVWYGDYGTRHDVDGKDAWLVATHRFTSSWDSWEVHPAGHEVVYCISGMMTLHQEFPDGRVDQVTISAGEYAINPPGVWHTADIEGGAEALFITAGWGTEGRPR